MHAKRFQHTDYSINLLCSELIRRVSPALIESIVTGSKLYRMPFAGKVYSFECIELASVVHFLQRVLKEQVLKYFIILQFDERHQYISFSLQEVKK